MGKHRPIVIVACKVFKEMLEEHLPSLSADQVTIMDYGLHAVPQKLTGAVQEVIDSLTEPSLVVLGYGLCGNGLSGIKAGSHTLLIARADDCIAMFLGSYDKYRQEFSAEPGTYWLTKGWLESKSDPLGQYEALVDKYGEETGQWILDQQYQHYERLVFIAHSDDDLRRYQPRARQVARFCDRYGMRYEEMTGSDHYLRSLLEAASALSNGASEEALLSEFIVVQPGGVLRQEMFFRQ